MNLPRDFRDLLEEFAHEGVEHVVIGGYAVAFHAGPRATKGGSPENLERAARALARYGAPRTSSRRQGPSRRARSFTSAGLRCGSISFAPSTASRYHDVVKNAVTGILEGTPIRVIGLDDLIANKRAAGRPQDLADVASLERVRAERTVVA
ncbi:MAG: hypothetical protein M3O46_10410 [Myxococcota bacterium]|nr:hypothetical protein [Myxococcota bacterium]